MKYDVQALFGVSSCRVVFVSDALTAKGVERSVAACKPAYQYEINEAFLPQKLGPFTFKNKKSLWEILVKTEEVKENGPEFLQKQTKLLDLHAYEDRVPAAISKTQQERASVLYDVMNHRHEFLISDCDTVLDVEPKPNGYTIAAWMKDYEGFEWVCCDLIWITYMKESELMDLLGEEGIRSSFYSFFTVADNRVEACDKSKLEEDYRKRHPKTGTETGKRSRPKTGYSLEEFEAIDFSATLDSLAVPKTPGQDVDAETEDVIKAAEQEKPQEEAFTFDPASIQDAIEHFRKKYYK